jgi:uncharacterized damage-inducible protein DinB
VQKPLTMSLFRYNVNKLEEVKNLLLQLPLDIYTKVTDNLSGASVGQHFRHIIEFYSCLEKGIKQGAINYDSRERNMLIETDIDFAKTQIENLCTYFQTSQADQALVMKLNCSSSKEDEVEVKTSLHREMAYVLDHTMHHLAIIKMGLLEEEIEMDENFGVAASTLRHRKQCAQ